MLILFIILLILIMFLFLDKSCDKQENFSRYWKCHLHPGRPRCCPGGWYGDPSDCKPCPSNRPSSPYPDQGYPDNQDCICPNATESSCFACSNPICRPFNPVTGKCTPVCDSCSVRRVGNKLVPHCT